MRDEFNPGLIYWVTIIFAAAYLILEWTSGVPNTGTEVYTAAAFIMIVITRAVNYIKGNE